MRALLGICTIVTIAFCAACSAQRPASPAVSRGQAVFEQQCAACHGSRGTGGPIGPALVKERMRRSPDRVRAIILDPDPPMPKLYPSQLSAADVRDVTEYVESL